MVIGIRHWTDQVSRMLRWQVCELSVKCDEHVCRSELLVEYISMFIILIHDGICAIDSDVHKLVDDRSNSMI